MRLIGIRPTAEYQPESGRIKAGYINSIPPAASWLLKFHGLIAVDGTTVTISMSARLGLLALRYAPAPWAHILTSGQLADFCAELAA